MDGNDFRHIGIPDPCQDAGTLRGMVSFSFCQIMEPCGCGY
jgi:hypothetical protein